LEEITLADEVGLDSFGIGEHHRPDFLDSDPEIILAAAAVKTRRSRDAFRRLQAATTAVSRIGFYRLSTGSFLAASASS